MIDINKKRFIIIILLFLILIVSAISVTAGVSGVVEGEPSDNPDSSLDFFSNLLTEGCIDTDGGVEPFQAGALYSHVNPGEGKYPGFLKDEGCKQNTLIEVYCDKREIKYKVINCKDYGEFKCNPHVQFNNPYIDVIISIENATAWNNREREEGLSEKEIIYLNKEHSYAAACVPEGSEDEIDPTQITQKAAPEFPIIGIVFVIISSLITISIIRKKQK